MSLFVYYPQAIICTTLPTVEFAYSSSTFPATGLTPFYLDKSCNPKGPVHLLDSAHQLQVQTVEDLQTELSAVSKDSTASYAAVREQKCQRPKSRFILPSYRVGDQVMLDISVVQDPHSRNRLSAKLNYKRIGPFKIIRLIGKNAVELLLPSTLRIHPVVNVLTLLDTSSNHPKSVRHTRLLRLSG